MSTNPKAADLLINPLVSEVLGEEFPVGTGVHTLARLAYDATTSGDLGYTVGVVRSWVYDPAWAPNVRAVVKTERVDARWHRVDGLWLSQGVGSGLARLAVHEVIGEARSTGIVLEEDDKMHVFALGSEAEMTVAKAAITIAAKDFFGDKIQH